MHQFENKEIRRQRGIPEGMNPDIINNDEEVLKALQELTTSIFRYLSVHIGLI